jgi:hypothetical protein
MIENIDICDISKLISLLFRVHQISIFSDESLAEFQTLNDLREKLLTEQLENKDPKIIEVNNKFIEICLENDIMTKLIKKIGHDEVSFFLKN